MNPIIRVMIVEDHPEYREGIALALDAKMARFILKNLEKNPPKPDAENHLSQRELEVLTLLGQGLLKKEISDRLAGLIPYYKIGRAVRFRKAELDAALERMRMG